MTNKTHKRFLMVMLFLALAPGIGVGATKAIRKANAYP